MEAGAAINAARLLSSAAAGPSGRCPPSPACQGWRGVAPQRRARRWVPAARAEASPDVQGYAAGDSVLEPLTQSGWRKSDTELRGLLSRIYQASDAPQRSERRARQMVTAPVRGVPCYVMLPLDTVWLLERDGSSQPVLIREKAMEVGLDLLSRVGVEGVMVDVWWGVCEHAGPRQYDFSAYRRLFEQVAAKGLKVQAVMSFHAAGSNVGDTCRIPLPKWVLAAGERDPEIFYTDRAGHRNRECLSLGCDDEAVLDGRTPVQAYTDFIAAFADEFGGMMGSVVTELTVGLGPAGEMRYPAYPEGDARWRFPGVGEFQCYDRYMLASLQRAADAVGQPEWGHSGPHDAGDYNSWAGETGFFTSRGSWDSEYGRFFLDWYSGQLTRHGDRVMKAAREVVTQRCRPRTIQEARELADGGTLYVFKPAVQLGVKLAGVHWYFKTRAHAAELTAGYYNTRDRNGYLPIFQMLRRHGAAASFTCVEMRDCEHPYEGRCSPEGLLNQVLGTAAEAGVPVSGENALQRYDQYAFDKILESALGQSVLMGRLERITFLRMGDMMVDNFDSFAAFLRRLTWAP